ncbi:hypothetical protein [Dongia rigui]|uniref:DUF922 domain-containing protein n=1 Tax=Dongia rigui TaxID=940149 RepID=A0ABU5DZV8_9PROT|nr:hypothetical protein [Dongia rigui]MDY0872867.1 hypothetical protein [Dongia rigui]
MATEPPIGNVLIGLVLLCLALLLPESAWAKSCTPPTDGPEIKIKLVEGKLAQNSALGLQALTRKMRPHEDPALKSIYSFGLTSVEWRSKADLQLTGMPSGATAHCWYVAGISMTITLRSTVFVAKEIARDSCPWREVLNHEQKHVTLNAKMFARLPKELKPRIAAVAGGGILSAKGQLAMATFRPRIEKAIGAALDDFSAAREKQHRDEIDTKAEYDRVDAACPEAEWDAVFHRAGLK